MMTAGGTIVTDQNDSRPGAGPTTHDEADGIDWDIVKAQARYEELTDPRPVRPQPRGP